MSKERPLLSRKVTVNDNYEISLGRLVFSSFIIGFQILGIICLNGWTVTPEVFFTLSSYVLSLQKRQSIQIKSDQNKS